jgi:GNAT superfamily N-acetyltransferase
VPLVPVEIRRGRPEDAAVLASIHVRSRLAAMPWIALVHDEAETRDWMEHVVLAEQHVLVAERDGAVVGFAAVHDDWLEQLYLEPDAIGTGAGWALLEAARELRPDGLSLWAFTGNVPARRFYERAGFELVEQGDGSGNEEREPDSKYVWRGRSGPRA